METFGINCKVANSHLLEQTNLPTVSEDCDWQGPARLSSFQQFDNDSGGIDLDKSLDLKNHKEEEEREGEAAVCSPESSWRTSPTPFASPPTLLSAMFTFSRSMVDEVQPIDLLKKGCKQRHILDRALNILSKHCDFHSTAFSSK